MSFSFPTLQDLLDRTRKAYRTTLPGSDAWIWPNNVYASAKVIAGAVFEVFGFAAFIAKKIFVSTAPDIETLRLHGNEYGMPQKPAYPASGTITITSTGDLAVIVGALFARTDGVQYIAGTAASRVGAGTLDIPVTAVADGANGNAEAGTRVEMLSGVTDANGDATAEVSEDIADGADVEDMETYRARILFRKRFEPHGGAPPDYVLWASRVIGVTRVFVERRWNGVGTVRVFVFMDNLYPNGIPPTDAIARVQSYIDTVSPAGAIVTVAAPTGVSVDVTLSELSPNTTTVQEAVKTSLREAFYQQSKVAGTDNADLVDVMPFLAVPQSFSRSWITQAVSNATGENRDTVSSPGADVSLTAGQTAILGNVTFPA